MTPLDALNVAPVVYQLTSVSIANPLTSTVEPSDLVSLSVWVPLLYVPPVTVTSDNVSNNLTVTVLPSFLVKTRSAFELLKVAPVT